MVVSGGSDTRVDELGHVPDIELSASVSSSSEESAHEPRERLMGKSERREHARGWARRAALAIQRRSGALRLLALALFTIGLIVISQTPALRESLSLVSMRARLRALAAERPVLSMLVYCSTFCAGELLHVPGIVFIVLGVLTFGRWLGFVLAYCGGLTSVCVSFVVVRWIGGQPIGASAKWARLSSFLQRMHAQPVAAIAAIRLVLWVAPPVNYALAMTQVRFVDYLLGSALGLVLPILALSLATDSLLPWLERREGSGLPGD